jgi:hypothetical protein
MCVDQSNAFTATLSWFVFILLALAVPAASHFIIACRDCDARHSRPYDAIVQISLSSVASLSFLCLSSFVRKYGLRRFLFLDKLCDESETVRMNYMTQLNVSILFLSLFNYSVFSFFSFLWLIVCCLISNGTYLMKLEVILIFDFV